MARNALKIDSEISNIYSGLLTEANITNNDALSDAITDLLDSNDITQGSPIDKWFRTQFIKWFKSPENDEEKRDMVIQHRFVKGEPEWMSKPDVMDFREFSVSEKDKLNHIIDFLKTYDENALKVLFKQPVPAIKAEVKKWDASMTNESEKMREAMFATLKCLEDMTPEEKRLAKLIKVNPLKEGVDFEVIKPAKHGRKWVKLITKGAYLFEGNIMGHCVSGYEPTPGVIIISLYDSNEIPHITIEITNGNEVQQIKGVSNMRPLPNYHEDLVEFIKGLVDDGYKVVGDGQNLDMGHYERQYYFKDSPEWQDIWTNKILPKQQQVFADLQKKIKGSAYESIIGVFDKTHQSILESIYRK